MSPFEDEPLARAAGLCGLAGLGDAFLAARWPDDIAILEDLAIQAAEQRREENKALAYEIAEAVRKVIDGK